MTTRNQVLATAASYLGYVEKRTRAHPEGNVTVFWDALRPDYQGGAWCAAFVNYCLKTQGITVILDEVDHPFYTPSMEAWAKRTRRWKQSKDCTPGDVLIFTEKSTVHTGFLERQRGGSVQTLEGNTSPGNRGSQANGGGVYRRVRARSWVRGCIDMSDFYSTARTTPSGTPTPLVLDGEMGTKTLDALLWYVAGADRSTGWTRDNVRDVQQWVGRPRTGVLTGDDVKAIQRKVGSAPDGDWPRRVGQKSDTTRSVQRFLNARIREASTKK